MASCLIKHRDFAFYLCKLVITPWTPISKWERVCTVEYVFLFERKGKRLFSSSWSGMHRLKYLTTSPLSIRLHVTSSNGGFRYSLMLLNMLILLFLDIGTYYKTMNSAHVVVDPSPLKFQLYFWNRNKGWEWESLSKPRKFSRLGCTGS
jgi:hypothetical protein